MAPAEAPNCQTVIRIPTELPTLVLAEVPVRVRELTQALRIVVIPLKPLGQESNSPVID